MIDLTRVADWTVPADEIDHLDHMSTMFYAWRANQAAVGLAQGLAGDVDLAANGQLFAVVDRHTHFRREQRLGARLAMTGGVTFAEGSRIGVYLEMSNLVTGDLAASFNLEVELQAGADRSPRTTPRAWREVASARRITPPQRSHPRTLPIEKIGARLRPEHFRRLGVASHASRVVSEAECGADGFLAPRRPELRPVEEHPKAGVMSGVWDSCPGYFWPAIEQRALRLRTPRLGERLESYEAVLGVHGKAIHSGVWTFDAESGAPVEIRHQVNIYFNGVSRRVETPPAEVRARLESLVSPGLLLLQPGT